MVYLENTILVVMLLTVQEMVMMEHSLQTLMLNLIIQYGMKTVQPHGGKKIMM